MDCVKELWWQATRKDTVIDSGYTYMFNNQAEDDPTFVNRHTYGELDEEVDVNAMNLGFEMRHLFGTVDTSCPGCKKAHV